MAAASSEAEPPSKKAKTAPSLLETPVPDINLDHAFGNPGDFNLKTRCDGKKVHNSHPFALTRTLLLKRASIMHAHSHISTEHSALKPVFVPRT